MGEWEGRFPNIHIYIYIYMCVCVFLLFLQVIVLALHIQTCKYTYPPLYIFIHTACSSFRLLRCTYPVAADSSITTQGEWLNGSCLVEEEADRREHYVHPSFFHLLNALMDRRGGPQDP